MHRIYGNGTLIPVSVVLIMLINVTDISNYEEFYGIIDKMKCLKDTVFKFIKSNTPATISNFHMIYYQDVTSHVQVALSSEPDVGMYFFFAMFYYIHILIIGIFFFNPMMLRPDDYTKYFEDPMVVNCICTTIYTMFIASFEIFKQSPKVKFSEFFGKLAEIMAMTILHEEQSNNYKNNIVDVLKFRITLP